MDLSGSADSVLLEGFRLDRRGGCLFRVDQGRVAIPVALGSRAVTLLSFLVERRGELVLKDELMAAVWPRRVVEEANLNVQVARLRHILDREREHGSCIQTIAGRGYCFVGAVSRPESPAQSALPAKSPNLARPRPRLSIVVLPFTNLSDDREQQYFADAIAEDLTTDLSRIPGMFVISRNSAFTYRNKPVDTKQIGHELCVGYVLEGSVRRSGNNLRVNAQLIDADTAAHLWAERFDGDTGDLFALQNEITSRIAVALNLELIDAEAARPAENPDAVDYILRGRAENSKPPTRENYATRISLYERALALDPRSVEAQSLLAAMLIARAHDEMAEDPAVDIARAERLIGQALATSPRSALAHLAKGHLLRARGRPEEAIPEYETVIASNRKRGGRVQSSRLVQIADRFDRGGDRVAAAGDPPQPARSLHRHLVFPDRVRASAAIAHRRGDRLVRKGARRQSRASAASRLPRRGVWAEGLDRTRRGGARRSPAAQRRSLFEHRQAESCGAVGGAGNRGLVRGDLFRRPAPGGNARAGTAGSPAATESPNLRRNVADLAAIGSGG
jgi:TolB-like protein